LRDITKIEAVVSDVRACSLDTEASLMIFVTPGIGHVAFLCRSLSRCTVFNRVYTCLHTFVWSFT